MSFWRKFLGIGIFLVIYVVEIIWIQPQLSAWGFYGDPWLPLVCFMAMRTGLWGGVLAGFIFGFAHDVISSPFMLHTFTRIILGGVWGVLRGGLGAVSGRFYFFSIVATAIGAWIVEWVILSGVVGQSYLPLTSLFTIGMRFALATGIWGIFWRWYFSLFPFFSPAELEAPRPGLTPGMIHNVRFSL